MDDSDLAMVEESALGQAILEQLRSVFEPLEIWYLRSSVDKVCKLPLRSLAPGLTLAAGASNG